MLAELLAEIPTALLAEIFLLLAENSRNFEPFLMFFTQIFKNHSISLHGFVLLEEIISQKNFSVVIGMELSESMPSMHLDT